MNLVPQKYQERLIDKKIAQYLQIFGAISIEGPKWCGKTWTSLNHAQSVTYMTEKSSRDLAQVDPKYIFTNENPQLIDEWQIVPYIWDSVRNKCDTTNEPGNFILTGSTSLSKEEKEETIFHSGTGRIATIRMHPMSLYESKDSSGEVSLNDMLLGNVTEKHVKKTELEDLAKSSSSVFLTCFSVTLPKSISFKETSPDESFDSYKLIGCILIVAILPVPEWNIVSSFSSLLKDVEPVRIKFPGSLVVSHLFLTESQI